MSAAPASGPGPLNTGPRSAAVWGPALGATLVATLGLGGTASARAQGGPDDASAEKLRAVSYWRDVLPILF